MSPSSKLYRSTYIDRPLTFSTDEHLHNVYANETQTVCIQSTYLYAYVSKSTTVYILQRNSVSKFYYRIFYIIFTSS